MKKQQNVYLISGLIPSPYANDIKKQLENEGYHVYDRKDTAALSTANSILKSCSLVVCVLDKHAKTGGDFETLLSAADHAKCRLLFLRYPDYVENTRLNSYINRGEVVDSEKSWQIGEIAARICDLSAPSEYAIPKPAKKLSRKINSDATKGSETISDFVQFSRSLNETSPIRERRRQDPRESQDPLQEAKAMLGTDPKQAYMQLKQLARQGNVKAMIILGKEFEKGTHFPADLQKAEKWFLSGMKTNSEEGIYQYGMFAFRHKQFQQAEEALKYASETFQHIQSTRQLLHWYENSPDEEKREQGINHLLDILIQHHDPQAMIERAKRLRKEVGTRREAMEKKKGLRRLLGPSEAEKQEARELMELDDQAFHLLIEAAKADKSAYVELALYHAEKGNDTQAVSAIQTAANSDVPYAQYLLGLWILEGRYGLTPNHAKAVKWLRRASVHVPEAAMLLKDGALSGYQ